MPVLTRIVIGTDFHALLGVPSARDDLGPGETARAILLQGVVALLFLQGFDDVSDFPRVFEVGVNARTVSEGRVERQPVFP